jgi:hypothetical protein
MVKHLLCKHEFLSSNFTTTKKRKKRENETGKMKLNCMFYFIQNIQTIVLPSAVAIFHCYLWYTVSTVEYSVLFAQLTAFFYSHVHWLSFSLPLSSLSRCYKC